MGQVSSNFASGLSAAKREDPLSPVGTRSATPSATSGPTPSEGQGSASASATRATASHLGSHQFPAAEGAAYERASAAQRLGNLDAPPRTALGRVDSNIERGWIVVRDADGADKNKAVPRQANVRNSIALEPQRGSGSKHDPAYVLSSDSEDEVVALSDDQVPIARRRVPTSVVSAIQVKDEPAPRAALEPTRTRSVIVHSIKAEPTPQRSLTFPSTSSNRPQLPQQANTNSLQPAPAGSSEGPSAHTQVNAVTTPLQRLELAMEEIAYWERTQFAIASKSRGRSIP